MNVRNSQERPETYDAGNVVMAGTNEESIQDAVMLVVEQEKAEVTFPMPIEYRDMNYSAKAIRIILSSQHGGKI